MYVPHESCTLQLDIRQLLWTNICFFRKITFALEEISDLCGGKAVVFNWHMLLTRILYTLRIE